MDIHFDLSNGHEAKFVHLLTLYGALNEVYLYVMDRLATQETVGGRGVKEIFKNQY
jgi:hypothetical protein